MRILFLGMRRILCRPRFGGVHVVEVLNGLLRQGHRVTLLDGSFSAHDPGPSRGVVRRSRRGADRPLKGRDFLFTALSAQFARLVCAVWRTLLAKKRFDVIYARHGLLPIEWIVGRLFGIPGVKEVNGLYANEAELHGASKTEVRLLAYFENVSLPRADRFITVTPELRDVLVRNYGVHTGKITVIPNGANTDLFRPINRQAARTQLGLASEIPIVLFVGLLAAWQGVDWLIRSVPAILAEMPSVQVLLVGDGPSRAELEETADSLCIRHSVQFIGPVSYESVPLYCAASHVCVLPKIPMPTGYSPLKLREYLACGRPVVATRIPSFHVLEEMGAGVLAEHGDCEALATALLKVLEAPDAGDAMGLRGHRYVLEHDGSWAQVSERVAEVLESAVLMRKAHQEVA